MYSPEGREAVQVGVRRLGNVKAVWTMFDLREMSPDRNIGASWTIAQRRGQWTDEHGEWCEGAFRHSLSLTNHATIYR